MLLVATAQNKRLQQTGTTRRLDSISFIVVRSDYVVRCDTMDNPRETYLDQILFHLIQDGTGNRLVSACSKEQREFVADFLEYLVEKHCSQIEAGVFTSDDILRRMRSGAPTYKRLRQTGISVSLFR
jgi:hypothetical protein